MAKKTSSGVLVTFLLLGGVTIALLVIVLKPFGPITMTDNEADDHGDEYHGAPAVSFDFVMPDDWKYIENAREDIQSLAPGQEITFGVLNDPTERNEAFFAATAVDPDNNEHMVLSVYKYDTLTYHFERIYRKTYSNDFPGLEVGIWPTFHVIGYDDGKLVILAQDLNDSPGPCTEVTQLGRTKADTAREMLSLDVSDPYAKGLVAYSVPDDVFNAGQQKERDCLDNL